MLEKLPLVPVGEQLRPSESMDKLEIVAISGFDALVLDPRLRSQRSAPAPVNLNDVIERMVGGLRRAFGKTYQIVVVRDETVPLALADPTQLETALLNVALNARDAMPGGGTVSIESGVAAFHSQGDIDAQEGALPPGKYVTLAVSDRGTGMTPEMAVSALQPPPPVKPGHRVMRMGLQMVSGFVRLAGGHLRIYSKQGTGTTVKLFLPAMKISGGPAAHAADEQSKQLGSFSAPERREALSAVA